MNKNKDTHFLHPSKIYVSRESINIITVLGSCVAVCLYDNKQKIGGINHFMLPLWNGKGLASPKYANIAVKKLIEKMEGAGANRKNLVAKIFGGGDVINMDHEFFRIGQRNIEIARKLLKEENIKIVSESTGGRHGRKILFSPDTGQILMKKVKKQALNEEYSKTNMETD